MHDPSSSAVAAIDGGRQPSRIVRTAEPQSKATSRRGDWTREAVGLFLASFGSLMAGVLGLQVWRMNPRVPLGASPAVEPAAANDALLTLAGTKTIDNSLWYFSTPRLGAPFGQDLRFFPAASGDALHIVVFKLLGLFTDNVTLIVNFWALLTFPLVGIGGYIGARLLGQRRAFSVFFAVVFAALPFHFLRVGVHPWLANYSSVPLFLALGLRQACAEQSRLSPLFRRVNGARGYGMVHRDSLIGFAILVYTATTGMYFALFSVLVLVFSSILGIARRNRTAWIGSMIAIGVIGSVLALQVFPVVLAQRSADGPAVQERSVAQLEEYALRPAVMLSPISGHRLDTVADLRERLPASVLTGESESEALGLLGTLGVGVGAAVLLFVWIGRGSPRWLGALTDAPVFMLGLFAVGTVNGLNMFGSYAGFTYVRAWNRSAVVIGALALLLISALLASLVASQRFRRWGRPAPLGLALSSLALLGVLDQTSAGMVPSYDQAAATWQSDRQIVQEIERSLPAGSAVFNLPVADFPEAAPMYEMKADSQLVGYIHSENVDWSYGGVKRREADWRYQLDVTSPALVDELIVTGFSGALVDTRGYGDGGKQIDDTLTEGGAVRAYTSRDRNQVYYSFDDPMKSLNERITPERQADLRAELLRTPLVAFGTGFYGSESSDKDYLWHWAPDRARLEVTVPDATTPVPATLLLDVRTYTVGVHHLFVRVGDDGPVTQSVILPLRKTLEIPVVLEPGSNEISLWSDAPPDLSPDPRSLVFQVFGFPMLRYEGR